MGSAIIKLFTGVLLFNMPYLFNMMIVDMKEMAVQEAGSSSGVSQVSVAVLQSIEGLSGVMGVMFAFMGILMVVKAMFEIKDRIESNKSSVIRDNKAMEKSVKPINVEKESIYTNDSEIDNLINIINNKSEQILSNPSLEINHRHTTEKVMNNYLPQVIKAYKSISPELRNKKIKNNPTAVEMTKEQLNIIISGLEEVDLNLLNKTHDKLRVNEKILNTVFKKSDLEIEI